MAPVTIMIALFDNLPAPAAAEGASQETSGLEGMGVRVLWAARDRKPSDNLGLRICRVKCDTGQAPALPTSRCSAAHCPQTSRSHGHKVPASALDIR